MGTLLTKRLPMGPYGRPMPRAPWWALGVGVFFCARYPCMIPAATGRHAATCVHSPACLSESHHPFRFFSFRHRRTPELVLQKCHASFRITFRPPGAEDRGRNRFKGYCPPLTDQARNLIFAKRDLYCLFHNLDLTHRRMCRVHRKAQSFGHDPREKKSLGRRECMGLRASGFRILDTSQVEGVCTCTGVPHS